MPVYHAPLLQIDPKETRRYAGLMKAKDFDEQMILDNVLPKMLVAGFICLTITSVLITGVFVNYLIV